MKKKSKRQKLRTYTVVSPWIIFLSIAVVLFVSAFMGRRILSDKISNKSIPSPTPTSSVSVVLPPRLGSAEYVNKAKASLGQKLGVSFGEITVVKVEEKQWNDTSIGCPEEGMMYSQVITPGYLITLSAKGQKYTFHAGGDRIADCE